MIVLTLFLIVIVLLYYYFVLPNQYWAKKGIQHAKPALFFGSFYENWIRRKSFSELIENLYMQFKHYRYSGIYNLTKPILLVNDIDLIKLLTIKDFEYFTDHMAYARADVDSLWSKNIFAMRGESWRDMRATLSPAFTGSKMRFMFNLINDCAENFAEYYLKQDNDIISLEMKDAYSRTTNDIIASCAFGIQCDSLNDRENEFYVKSRKAFDFSGFRQFNYFLYNACPKLISILGLKVFTNEIGDFFRSVINETIDMREKKGIVRPDLINLLLEARNGKLQEENTAVKESFAETKEYSLNKKINKIKITNEDITAQALIFFVGGFDTTSYLLCFLSYELAVNLDVQEKLRKEIQETLEECNGKLTYVALMKMKYLDMVISEVLRKWPAAVVIDRICTKDYIIKASKSDEKDYLVKKNDVIWFPTFGIHRDPDFYPNPGVFDPERFSAENRGNINASSYIPFGTGPRNCIGSRFAILINKAVIFQLLRSFSIIPIEKTVIPLKISAKNMAITSENGFWLGLKRL